MQPRKIPESPDDLHLSTLVLGQRGPGGHLV